MIFLKRIFPKYAFTPIQYRSLLCTVSKPFFIVLIISGLTACNPVALVNPNSYGDKWENTYLWFEPGDMTTIYVSDSGDPKTAHEIPNNSDFLIEWNKKDTVYNLKVTSYTHDIDFAWFTGFDAENSSEEIPWVMNGNTIELHSDQLLPAENGKYQISISDDLKD